MARLISFIVALTALTFVFAAPSEGLVSRATASDISQYLAGHNNERAKHGAKALVWNANLASKAQQWANGCKFQHSQGQLGPYGENLAAGYGNGYNIPAAIQSWNNEASQYNASNPQYSHWTQVVWKSTTDLGCGSANCTGIFSNPRQAALYVVCEYSPAGNVIGHFAQNVQP